MIVKDEALLQTFRDKQACEWCGKRVYACEPHHHHRRGMGGGSQLDIPENLIGLCRTCHDLAQDYKISAADVLGKIAAREGLSPERCRRVIWETLAKPKPRKC